MTTITLFRGPNAWMAQSTDPETLRLFGTDTIPTAWTPRAPAETVRAGVASLNPGASVVVRPGE